MARKIPLGAALPLLGVLGLASPAVHAQVDGSQNAPRAPIPSMLEAVKTNVAALAQQGQRPVVVFDIDDTLTSTDLPRYLALKEAAQDPWLRHWYPQQTQLVGRLLWEKAQGTYELPDLLRKAGAGSPEFLAAVEPLWREILSSDKYIAAQQPLPGAPEYVWQLYNLGAVIVYLSGRTYQDGIREDPGPAFPLGGDRIFLMLKPRIFGTPTLEHKIRSLEKISSMGTIVAAFDDDPLNINAFTGRFPGMMAVYVVHRKRLWGLPPAPGVPRISDYLP